MATNGAEANNNEDVTELTTERGAQMLPAFTQSRTSDPGITMPTVRKLDQIDRVKSSDPLLILEKNGEIASPNLNRKDSSSTPNKSASEPNIGSGTPRASI